MVGVPTAVVSVAIALGGTVLCSAAVLTRRQRSAPAADEFAFVAGVAGVGAFAVAASVIADSGTAVLIAVTIGLVLPVPWLIFSFEYTGRSDLISRQTVMVVATPVVLGVLSVAVIFGSRLWPWLALPSREAATGLVAIAVFSITIAEWISLLYAGGLMLVGTGVLVWTFHRYDHLDSTSGTLLGVFGSIPWLSLLFGFQVSTVSPLAMPAVVAVGFLTGGAAVAVILHRRQLFQTLPAAGNIGPDTVIEDLNDVVVVADSEGTVVERNAAAERLVDGPVGGNVADLLGHDVRTIRETEVVDLQSSDGRRLFEPTVSELTDQHGLQLGHAVVLRDVTDRAIRRQRLEVLNRFLRHNLRNDMTVIQGRAELLAEGVTDPALVDSAEMIVETGQQLAELSETARDIERLLSPEEVESRAVALDNLTQDLVEEVPEEAVGESDVPEGLVVQTAGDLLETALRALVENAVEHNDAETPSVTVSASLDPEETYPVTLVVADNGPGIPEVERETVLDADETPLRHGSGLGLWLVRWVVTRLGGELAITEGDPRGTTVSLKLPNGHMTEPDAKSESVTDTAASANVEASDSPPGAGGVAEPAEES
jgi:signal transduction histidine kinase